MEGDQYPAPSKNKTIIGADGPAPRRWEVCPRRLSRSLEASHALRCLCHYRLTTNYLR
jgi:hypothetical protein